MEWSYRFFSVFPKLKQIHAQMKKKDKDLKQA